MIIIKQTKRRNKFEAEPQSQTNITIARCEEVLMVRLTTVEKRSVEVRFLLWTRTPNPSAPKLERTSRQRPCGAKRALPPARWNSFAVQGKYSAEMEKMNI